MKARIKFSKNASMRFVGHLDIMRYFQKALRRSEFDMKYSQGYSPHQLISFASPLGVGLSSDSEYLDLEIGDCLSSKEMVEKLNSTMVEGIEILSFGALSDKSKNAMSIVAGADYVVYVKEGYHICDQFKEKFEKFYKQEEINIVKKTKKSEKEVNIKPLIYSIWFEENGPFDSEQQVSMQIATGSVNNLKPDLVMKAFSEYLNIEYNPFAYQVHRLEIYADEGDESQRRLVSLESFTTQVN